MAVKRSDKGKKVARYITGHAGVPFLRFEGITSTIEAPSPYSIDVVTDAKWWRFGEKVAATNEVTGIPFVVRYDAYITSVDEAVVGCNLRTFQELLHKYHN